MGSPPTHVRAAALADLCARMRSDARLSVGLKRSWLRGGGHVPPVPPLGSASDEVKITVEASGCNQFMESVDVVTVSSGCYPWVRPVGVVTRCGQWVVDTIENCYSFCHCIFGILVPTF